MSSGPDPYRDWDAAYVLGSLPPGERTEYEQHLTSCPSCSASVTELAGMSGVLRVVPDYRGMALLEQGGGPSEAGTDVTDSAPVPPTLLPGFVDATRRARSRSRARKAWLAGSLAAAAAAAVVLTLVAIGLVGSPVAHSRHLTMTQTEPSPITAEVTLTEQAWGTSIEIECSYASSFNGQTMDSTRGYALYVVDRNGREAEQATWQAAPGSTVTPIATTILAMDEIDRIEIRLLDSGRVLLEVAPEF